MKTMNTKQLVEFLKSPGWERTQKITVMDHDYRKLFGSYDDDGSNTEVKFENGFGEKISTLDGVTIIHEQSYDFDTGNPDSLNNDYHGVDIELRAEGVEIIDEENDGKILTPFEVRDLLDGIFHDDNSGVDGDAFMDIDYSEHIK